MDTHHCPRCELRFVTTAELRQHFEVDHGGDAATFERYRYRAGPSTSEHRRTLLLVGNQTLEDGGVLAEVVARAGNDARVLVLVPATGAARTAGRPAADDPAVAIATWRLGAALDHLRAAGVDAEGRVGEPDPYAAVNHVLAEEHVDEIVVSTLPASSSRWLGVDLPDRLRRHTRCAIDVLTPADVAGR
jgi:hypothetical protein